MIVKVFACIMSRTIGQPRCLDLTARRFLFSICKKDMFTSRRPFIGTCGHSDFCAYSTIRENHKRLVRLGSVSSNHLPLRISARPLSREGAEKEEREKINAKSAECPKTGDNIYKQESSEEEKKLSIFQRFKNMYRDYWYVLVPVHVITSLGWFGGFYYLAKSGVDVVAIVEAIGISEHIPDTLKDSSAGYLAVSYALYKIATPLRYMVTIGGTTMSIRYLKTCGYIKPIPPKEKLKELYQEKKENFKERRQHLADGIKQKREKFKERKETLMRERRERAGK